jgi:DnaJ-domain-containing protein 1
MSREELLALHGYCLKQDEEGARLLEAYLDRRFPGWRPAGQVKANAWGGASHGSDAGGMTEDEAYDVLGLAKGASPEEITRAHRELMKKMHPDAGGSSELAARVNVAKTVLMRRHRT